jgi:hypothetical protein
MASTAADLPFPTSSSNAGSSDDGHPAGVPPHEAATSDATESSDPTALPSGDELLGRVVQGAHSTIDRLAETAAPRVQRLQEGVAQAADSLHAGAEKARQVGDEWTESMRATVRQNPIAALATAFAVGALIVRITR